MRADPFDPAALDKLPAADAVQFCVDNAAGAARICQRLVDVDGARRQRR